MTYRQLNTIAKTDCNNYRQLCGGEMTFCTHQDNKCQTEGNCPRLQEMTDLAIDDLFNKPNYTKHHNI